MPFSHGSKAKVYVNGYDLSPFLKSVQSSASVDTAETSALGTTDKTYVPGLRDATVSAEGMYDGTAGAIDPILDAALGTTTKSDWLFLPAGDGFGNRAKGIEGDHTSYEVSAEVSDMASVSVEAQSSTATEALLVLHPFGAETATGNDSSINNTAASTNGGVGYVQLTAYSGLTNIIVKIQDSADNSSFADIITFATITAANKYERKTVAGNVRQYVRSVRTVSGVGSASYIVAFGRK